MENCGLHSVKVKTLVRYPRGGGERPSEPEDVLLSRGAERDLGSEKLFTVSGASSHSAPCPPAGGACWPPNPYANPALLSNHLPFFLEPQVFCFLGLQLWPPLWRLLASAHCRVPEEGLTGPLLSLIHISEPTRLQ